MNKKFFTRMILVIGIYIILYLAAIFFQSNLLAGILSTIGGIISFAAILHGYFRIKKTKLNKIWLIFSLAPLCWVIAAIYWMIDGLILGNNADNNTVIKYIYLGTNIFLFIGSFLFGISKLKKWNAFQLVVDLVVMSISFFYLLWILVIDKNFDNLGIWAREGSMVTTALILDIAMSIGTFVWCFSIRGGIIPPPVRMVSCAIMLYVATDVVYFYFSYQGAYAVNALIDFSYMVCLLAIAVGALYQSYSDKKVKYNRKNNISNIGYRYRSLFILPAPVLLLIFKPFDWFDMIVYAMIILIHGGLSSYIQAFIKNEHLLKREKRLNKELEKRIFERTEELVVINTQLGVLANQDHVTNLYNRRYFMTLINEKMQNLSEDETLAIIYIDLDRFKIINDTYGHLIGDEILFILSERFQKQKPKDALIARLGGDEFVVGICGKYGYPDIEQIAQELIVCSSIPVEIGNYSFQVTISTGISIYPLDAGSSDSLMRNADIAMYQAKKAGYNKCVSFNENLEQTIRRKNKMELLLKNAEISKEFVLHYQPQYDIKTNKIIGMEALIRWNCPKTGLIYPGEFIPIAEETELIIPIGNWVMETAIKQISKWNKLYHMDLKVGINVSPKQLNQIDFKQNLCKFIKKYKIHPDWVDIEITEGVAIEGQLKIEKISKHFDDTGVSISIDDFGTGYSSLSCLKFLPFARVKIAKELIDNITVDHFDRQIVKSIITLSDSIGIKTIAEGVERKEQFELLRYLGCKQIQGYYIGKPVSASVFEKTILNNTVNIQMSENTFYDAVEMI